MIDRAVRIASMRRVCYAVACSLDGYIADRNGGADWIPHEPEIDFTAIFAQFDTFLMGRLTYETMIQGGQSIPGKVIVFSRSLPPAKRKNLTITAANPGEIVRSLAHERGKDIWLFGGGQLFRALAAEDLVDTVEVAIAPVMLGAGIPLLPPIASEVKLRLTGHTIYPSGVALLRYDVVRR